MNPALAKLYGLDKTASAPEEQELDLDNMTARELLALLEAEETPEVPEKTASPDDLDLSKMSGAELLKLIQESEVEEETVEKTAGVAFYEEAGRAMARAFHAELEKSASPDEIEIDLNAITGEQLVELLESYDFVDEEPVKVAGASAEVANEGMTHVGKKMSRFDKLHGMVKRHPKKAMGVAGAATIAGGALAAKMRKKDKKDS
jgi:hypothetical protein